MKVEDLYVVRLVKTYNVKYLNNGDILYDKKTLTDLTDKIFITKLNKHYKYFESEEDTYIGITYNFSVRNLNKAVYIYENEVYVDDAIPLGLYYNKTKISKIKCKKLEKEINERLEKEKNLTNLKNNIENRLK